MAKDRTGKFWWEYDKPHYITLTSMRGEFDPALSSDCRCGQECYYCNFGNCLLRPWIALSSIDNWGEECLNPDGLPYGDYPDPDKIRVPWEERLACDSYGNPLNQEWNDEMYGDDCPEDCLCFECKAIEKKNQEAELKAKKTAEELERQCLERLEKVDNQMSVEDFVLKNEVNGYDPDLDNLPKFLSKSPDIVGGLWNRKDFRMWALKSYPNGKRGNDRYKEVRARVSQKKLRRIAKHINEVFVYDLEKDQTSRVTTV